jgi:hypothetical protein
MNNIKKFVILKIIGICSEECIKYTVLTTGRVNLNQMVRIFTIVLKGLITD